MWAKPYCLPPLSHADGPKSLESGKGAKGKELSLVVLHPPAVNGIGAKLSHQLSFEANAQD